MCGNECRRSNLSGSYGTVEAILDVIAAYGPVEPVPGGILCGVVREQTETEDEVTLSVAQVLREDGYIAVYDDEIAYSHLTPSGEDLRLQCSAERSIMNRAWLARNKRIRV